MRPYETKRKTTEVRSGTLGNRCQKCGGYILIGDTRFGTTAPEIEHCFNCGLNSESTGYMDALENKWIELKE